MWMSCLRRMSHALPEQLARVLSAQSPKDVIVSVTQPCAACVTDEGKDSRIVDS